jgi:hypothetical protein
MLNFLKSILTQTVKVQPEKVIRGWKQGMWVMITVTNKPAILFRLGESCEVHLVNPQTGVTVEKQDVPLTGLRQAKWAEIPLCRRGITQEEGKALGYGS